MERPTYDPTIVAVIGDPAWLADAPEEGDAPETQAGQIYLGYDAALRGLKAELAALGESGRFSPAGLAEEAARLGRERLAEIARFDGAIAALAARRNALAADAPAPPDPPPALVARVWDWLPQDNASVFAVYLDALERDDGLTAAAIETLPRFLPFALDDDQRREGVALRLARSDPGRSRALAALETIVDDLDAARAGARAEIARLTGLARAEGETQRAA